MKKLFSLIAFALISMGASAQHFCDDEFGVPSETVFEMKNCVVNDFEEIQVPLENFGVINNTEDEITFTVNLKVTKCDSGAFQCCEGGNCSLIGEGKSKDYTFTLGKGEDHMWQATEWTPEEGVYGTCETVFTMSNGDVAYVNFIYDENSGVHAVVVNPNTKSDANYNVAGQRVNANAKGVVISNGKKVVR